MTELGKTASYGGGSIQFNANDDAATNKLEMTPFMPEGGSAVQPYSTGNSKSNEWTEEQNYISLAPKALDANNKVRTVFSKPL